MVLKLFNTLTRQKQEFVPLEKGKVKMYSCGPTVYNYAHVGNFRSYIFADILKRYLKYKGYDVTHVMNITDVDDKTIRGSQEKGQSLKEFTDFFTKEFFRDFDALNIQRPDTVPRATETIPEMVSLVEKLLKMGFAYKGKDGSIYFDISKFSDYGKMANLDLKGLKSGARVCHDEYGKDNVSDFALWKSYDKSDGDVFWETPIGKGRPGWHLECSAMSMKYLGESIDIHTGGVDLIFPHHQNEVAQSEAVTGKIFVRYWVHCNHLMVDGKKMSKSLGNFYTVRELFDKGFSPKAVRYVLLSTHYRQQLNLTMESLDAAENAVARLEEFISRLKSVKADGKHPEISKLAGRLKDDFEKSLDDDLFISQALAALFEFVKKINRLIDDGKIGKDDAEDILELLEMIDSVLGVMAAEDEKIPEDIVALAEKRLAARNNKDWETSDRLRDEINKSGYRIDDTPDGYKLKKN